jgi:hypothetical protein
MDNPNEMDHNAFSREEGYYRWLRGQNAVKAKSSLLEEQ